MSLSEEAKEARRQYIKEWRRKNPGKVKEYNNRHWERVAERTKSEEGQGDER